MEGHDDPVDYVHPASRIVAILPELVLRRHFDVVQEGSNLWLLPLLVVHCDLGRAAVVFERHGGVKLKSCFNISNLPY